MYVNTSSSFIFILSRPYLSPPICLLLFLFRFLCNSSLSLSHFLYLPIFASFSVSPCFFFSTSLYDSSVSICLSVSVFLLSAVSPCLSTCFSTCLCLSVYLLLCLPISKQPDRQSVVKASATIPYSQFTCRLKSKLCISAD